MTANELRKKFIEFFEGKGHKVIPSASLVPENDPTALFVSAGMQPLVPYLMGETHPAGKKLVDVQKCIRTDDIDEVGDKVHHTFFEMLGNWSLGDYFKQEAIEWSYEFLTNEKWLGIDKSRFAVSVFAGDDDASFDQESYDKWLSLGISADRIAKLPKKNNWWGPIGETGPCGPDTEMFIWTGEGEAPANFQETCNDPNWVEVWNDVFMEYNRTAQGYKPLAQKNVDTGMGLERMLAVMNGVDDNYRTDLFWPIIEKIEEISGQKYEEDESAFRVIADHIRAAVFAIGDGVAPSNKSAGYIVRRLIRRAIVKANQLGITDNFTTKLTDAIFDIYQSVYFSHSEQSEESSPAKGPVCEQSERAPRQVGARSFASAQDDIKKELDKEETKFRRTLNAGLKDLETYSKMTGGQYPEEVGKKHELSGDELFDLYQSKGLPLEISLEEAERLSIPIKQDAVTVFEGNLKLHQELSRTASAGMFKGGLADAGEMAVKYHTATHLLHQALRQVLGDHVGQKGSNINAERLRFDFTHPEKMTPEQITEVENIVNEQIGKNLPVILEEMSPEEAKNSGALGFFEHKYGDIVKVYTIGGNLSTDSTGSPQASSGSREFFSREICGGPHVENTSVLGHFRIKKEEASSAGVRRIKAILE